ncbi:hypothetical protein CH375_15670 [Leptospira ellisii]|uniref:Uncharacterized protein n=1 Tax=Leptospira ellisii TaxID=2023197 RepID=A0A2N0BI34_9LEPT|nr:hypothetical protein CH379_12305 [Leptospira ellisii]PKA03665.1 hypothetical protein CH375_15670 [Leptospira ellisii]
MTPEIEILHPILEKSLTLKTIKRRNHEIHPSIKKIFISNSAPPKKEITPGNWQELYKNRMVSGGLLKVLFNNSAGEDREFWFKPSTAGGRSRLFVRQFRENL